VKTKKIKSTWENILCEPNKLFIILYSPCGIVDIKFFFGKSENIIILSVELIACYDRRIREIEESIRKRSITVVWRPQVGHKHPSILLKKR